MGRKNLYETLVQPYLKDIPEWYELMTERQIAQRLGLAIGTFQKYKKDHPELKEALKVGKVGLIEELKSTLKKKAKGFYYEETKTFIKREGDKQIETVEKYRRYAPPDTGAIHLLLKNLDETWRNDDQATLDIKREKLNLEKQKAEADSW